MRLLIQRVNHASVKVDGEVIGNIGKGFLVLVGIGQNDTREIADKYMKKMLGLRIFEDENGKTNLSLARCKWGAFDGFAIHVICQLQKREPAKLY